MLIPALVLGTVLAVPLSVKAQDQGAATQGMTGGQKRQYFLRQQLAPLVPQDFERALASVGEFLQADAEQDRWDRVRFISEAGYLLYFSTPEAKRAAVAAPTLQFLDDEIQLIKTRDSGDPDFQSWETRVLLNVKVKILLAAKRAPEAVKVLEQWRALRFSYLDDPALDDSPLWSENWRAAQNQQKQPAPAVSGLVKEFEAGLLRRNTFARGLTSNIISELLAQDKPQEALSWAKLEFSLCPFDEGAIREATKDVDRCLSAGELTLARVNQFAAAQTDPAAPNPLDKVSLPPFDTAAIRAQLADPDSQASFEMRLNQWLAVGDYRNAMLLARKQLVGDVTNQNAALQVARVFKAKDGDIVRANGFLTYYQTGQGDNPIPAFLKETETADAAAS